MSLSTANIHSPRAKTGNNLKGRGLIDNRNERKTPELLSEAVATGCTSRL
jgi:hypothetical protein